MRGIHSLQSPGILHAYGSLQSLDSKVLALRKTDSQIVSGAAKCGIVHSGTNLDGLDSEKYLSSYRSNISSFSLQHNHLRLRGANRKFNFGLLHSDLSREGTSSFLRAPFNATDHDSVPTTTTSSNVEDEQNDPTTEKKITEAVEQGIATKSGLNALEAYFNKLNGRTSTEVSKGTVPFSSSSSVQTVLLPSETAKKVATPGATIPAIGDSVKGGKDIQGLKALDAYFDKLNPKKPDPVQEKVEAEQEPAKPVEKSEEELFLETLLKAKEEYDKIKASGGNQDRKPSELKVEATSRIDEDGNELDLSDWEVDEAQSTSSDLINVLVAVNIAVYLFGLASPHEAFGITDSSLPFVYGAKVNELILAGQWWRVITPMFLHASLLHVGLGSWALLSFGPAVESAYGTLGFAMIYFLGGIFGNLLSFFHTNDWTVGGTGPIYALVGTWLVYLLKNRETIGKEIADDMIRKVIILSALNVALWNSPPIDDWTHLGAIVVGTFFGILASPTMQLNLSLKEVDPDSKEEMGEAFLWFNDGLSPARLTLVFALFLGIFYCLYQVGVTGSSDFYLLQDNPYFS